MSKKRYEWGVRTPNAASLAAISLNRVRSRNADRDDGFDFDREEAALLAKSVPGCSEWAGAVGFERFNRYALKWKLEPDQQLSTSQAAETMALLSLVREKLLPAILFFQWIDDENYTSWTKPEVSKLSYFPFCLYEPAMIQRTVAAELTAIMNYTGGGVDAINNSIDIARMRDYVMKLAKEAIGTLSNRLRLGHGDMYRSGDGSADGISMFHGYAITTIDCLVYGYLGVILGARWKNPALQEIITGNDKYMNLSRYVDEVGRRLFPEVPIPSITRSGLDPDPDREWYDTVIKRTLNVTIILGFAYIVLASSPYMPIARINARVLKRRITRTFDFLYPKLKQGVPKEIPIVAQAETPSTLHAVSKFTPPKPQPGFSALG